MTVYKDHPEFFVFVDKLGETEGIAYERRECKSMAKAYRASQQTSG